VAPGEYIVAARSRDASPDDSRSDLYDPTGMQSTIADDGVHAILRGTSQAAPMVTGTIALLFQAVPTATSTALREALRATAAPIDGTDPGYSIRMGFGRVDVPRAIDFLHGVRGAIVNATRSTVGVSRDLLPPDTDETTIVSVTPRDAAGTPLGAGHDVEITLSAGEPEGGVRDLGGRYERTFVAHAPRGTVGVVDALVDGTSLAAHPRVTFVPSRTEVGGALQPGGGCDFAGGGRVASLATALFVFFCGVQLLRRRRS
jgi:hypothetical protein